MMMCLALATALLVDPTPSHSWPRAIDWRPWSMEQVEPVLSVAEVAQRLNAGGAHFAALAVSIEGIATKPYRDRAGLNIGMGYCVSCRLNENGVERVRADFLNAGLTPTDADALLGSNRHAQARVRLTLRQAVALLGVTESDYRTRARDIVGPSTFDQLPPHRQAALTWLSYNTGEGLTQFRRLLSAVRSGRHVDALEELTPHFQHRGQRTANARAGAWLMAAYWSDEAMTAAISNPDALEYGARNGRSPLDVVAPSDARRLAKEGRLPGSPYIRQTPVVVASLSTPTENLQ